MAVKAGNKTATAQETANGKRPAFSWAQPVCPRCWVDIKIKTGRLVPDHQAAYCCYCRDTVPKGKVYITRLNPSTVPYPTIRKIEDED